MKHPWFLAFKCRSKRFQKFEFCGFPMLRLLNQVNYNKGREFGLKWMQFPDHPATKRETSYKYYQNKALLIHE